ncbi:MAG: hypothetical protein MUC98_19170 [Desulfobacterota bacterium]|nr:hypothetical protein [Thermodesulfobacteriota bacterium]
MTTIPLLIIAGTVAAAGYLVSKFLLKLYRKPVLAIDLSPIDQPKWSDPKKIDELTEAFLCNGFEKAGHYRCWQIPSLILSGFVRPSEQTAGVIYDHPTSGIWVDCYVEYEDGGSLTVSNAPSGQEMDPMPQRTKIYSRETAVDALLKKLRAEARHGERVTITKEVFSSHVMASGTGRPEFPGGPAGCKHPGAVPGQRTTPRGDAENRQRMDEGQWQAQGEEEGHLPF